MYNKFRFYLMQNRKMNTHRKDYFVKKGAYIEKINLQKDRVL